MAKSTKRTKIQRGVGQRVRELRKAKGLTGEELADRLGVSQATVSKLETGVQPLDLSHAVKLAAALNLSKQETAQLMAESGAGGSTVSADRIAQIVPFDFLRRGEPSRRQAEAARIEAKAKEIREFAPTLVPGLLQTESYARAAIRLSGITRPDEIDEGVKGRLNRQKALRERKQFRFVLSESALRSRIASCSELRRQLQHLKRLARRKNVRIGVITWSVRLPTWLPPNFALFDDRLAYVELPHAELSLTGPVELKTYSGLFEDLERAAAYDGEFDATLERVAGDLERLDDAESSLHPTLC